MANNHLIDGLESHDSKHQQTIIYKNKRCKICDSNEFVVFDGIYVCCRKCGIIADTLSFQTCDINKAEPMGFNTIHKKKHNAKNIEKLKKIKEIKEKKLIRNAKRKIKEQEKG